MTILGSHTVAELRDLLSSYNYQQTQLENAVAGARSNWIANDAAGYQKWQNDYDAWNVSYQPARSAANTELASIPTSLQDVTTWESGYAALAAAFLPFADLDRRMRQSPVAAVAPKYENNPQPTAPDADLGAYKETDAATRAMPDVVKTFIATVAPGLVPKTKDQPNYKPVSNTTWALLGLGALAALALVVKVAK